MNNFELERLINQTLNITAFHDYAPNGLQVQGRDEVKKIITGVTACQALLEKAIEKNADAILVHHGYFWKGEDQRLIGMKGRRIKALMMNDINLYAYHLPLDSHPELGNNIQLAKRLGLQNIQPFENNPTCLLVRGEFSPALSPQALQARLAERLQRNPLVSFDNAPTVIKTVGICTGGGQDFITDAIAQGCDAFVTGEVSERTIHNAREDGINFYAAGHHATERYGIKALGKWLAQHYGFDVEFVDIDNPA